MLDRVTSDWVLFVGTNIIPFVQLLENDISHSVNNTNIERFIIKVFKARNSLAIQIIIEIFELTK